MILDMTFFGYGAGIVIVGWVLGTCVGLAYKAIKLIGGS